MAQRRFQFLQNDPNISPFVVEGIATGRQLGVGSYGSVEEVYIVVHDQSSENLG